MAAVGLAAWLLGCSFAGQYPAGGLKIEADVQRPAKSVVIFFVDGMDRSRMEGLIVEGELPNIEKRFVRGGVGVDYAITSMPALTYPNCVSLVTGCFPGRHGILGNRWFDRYQLYYQNYLTASTYLLSNQDFLTPTLFEILSDHFTVNVQGHTRRGVSDSFDAPIEGGLAWLFQTYSCLDDFVGTRFASVVELANHVGRWPSVLMLYFPGVDEVGHLHGPQSPQYADALRTVDRAIGRVMGTMDEMGLSVSSYFVLATDHGHVAGHRDKVFDIADWLRRERGFRTYDGLQVGGYFDARFSFFDRYDAVVISGSYRRAAIHLKGNDGWANLPTHESIERVIGRRADSKNDDRSDGKTEATELYKHPSVGLACFRAAEGRVRVISSDGEAIVERKYEGSVPLYRIRASATATTAANAISDPLGFETNCELARFIKAGYWNSREWLKATAATSHPDFVPQVVEMFDTHRAGDIVLFAAEDWAFGRYERGGHGSSLAQDMRVPMYFAGGELQAGASIGHARLVDVMPTVLDLLGEIDRLKRFPPIDGVSILPQLKEADAAESERPQ